MMSETKSNSCLVMLGHHFQDDWEPQSKGLVKVAVKEAATKGGGVDQNSMDFDVHLKKGAIAAGANLVTDVTFVPMATCGGEYRAPCHLMVVANAYYVPQLEPDYEPQVAHSQ
jgi:hypothetical protein